MIKAVLFDMDGLMIDSETAHCMAFDKVLQKYGYRLSRALNTKLYLGVGDPEASRDMVNRFHLPITAEELLHQKESIYFQIAPQEVKIQSGLRKLLKKLKQDKLLTAVASGSTRQTILNVLNSMRLKEYFTDLCSAEEVSNGKPSPEIYLYTAEKLHAMPGDCLVLEDAPSGITSANAAGMISIAIPSRETKNLDFTNANYRLTSLNEVYDLITLLAAS